MIIKTKKLYLQDCAVVFFAMLILWIVLLFVITRIGAIVPNNMVKIVIISAGILVGTFATASLIAVFIHLKKNKKQIYLEELLCKEKNS